MSPHLTDEEIANITKPLKPGAARCRYFQRLGMKVKPRPNGQPLVSRAHFDEVMRGHAEAANDGTTARRDWSGLRKKVRYGRGEKAERRQPARP